VVAVVAVVSTMAEARWQVVAVVAVVAVAVAAVAAQDSPVRYVLADELRDHRGRCFDASRCALRHPGARWTVSASCERATCQRAPNGTLLERRQGCPRPSPKPTPDCYSVRVVGRPFPDCCPALVCPTDEPVLIE